MRRKRKKVFVLVSALLALFIFYTLNRHGHSVFQAISSIVCDEVRGRKVLHDLVCYGLEVLRALVQLMLAVYFIYVYLYVHCLRFNCQRLSHYF